MSKRKLLLVLIVVAILAGIGMYAVSRQKPKSKDANQTTNAYAAGSREACELLPLSVTKNFLGGATARNMTTPDSRNSTEGVNTSICTYEETKGSTNVISLTVRGAQGNQTSYAANRYAFDDARQLTPGSGDGEQASVGVPSLGEAAYYNPSTELTNILVRDGQYWLIIQAPDKDIERKVGQKILQKLDL